MQIRQIRQTQTNMRTAFRAYWRGTEVWSTAICLERPQAFEDITAPVDHHGGGWSQDVWLRCSNMFGPGELLWCIWAESTQRMLSNVDLPSPVTLWSKTQVRRLPWYYDIICKCRMKHYWNHYCLFFIIFHALYIRSYIVIFLMMRCCLIAYTWFP